LVREPQRKLMNGLPVPLFPPSNLKECPVRIHGRRRTLIASLASVAVASAIASVIATTGSASASVTTADPATGTGPTTGTLPVTKTILQSAIKIDLQNEYVRLPLH